MNNKKILLLPLLVIIFFYSLYFGDIISAEKLKLWLLTEGRSYALYLYLLMHLVRPASFLPSSLLVFVGGLTFPSWQGFLLSLIGFSFGSLFVYFFGKMIGKNWAINKFPKTKPLVDTISSEGAMIIASLRLIPIVPADLVSLAAGVSHAKSYNFMLGTILGSLPGLTLIFYMGVGIRQGRVYSFLFALAGLLILSVIVAKRKPNLTQKSYQKK